MKLYYILCYSVPAPPQLPFKRPEFPPNGDYKALQNGTSGGTLERLWSSLSSSGGHEVKEERDSLGI